MPRFLIKREVPGAGQMSNAQLHALSARSNEVLKGLQENGAHIQWDHSCVTDDTIHCVYVAQNADAIREHARCGGFPCDEIMPVRELISSTTGE